MPLFCRQPWPVHALWLSKFCNAGSNEHYSSWSGICLIQDGEVDTGPLDDVQHSWGLTRADPLWILPGVGPLVQGSSMHICRFACHCMYWSMGTLVWGHQLGGTQA